MSEAVEEVRPTETFENSPESKARVKSLRKALAEKYATGNNLLTPEEWLRHIQIEVGMTLCIPPWQVEIAAQQFPEWYEMAVSMVLARDDVRRPRKIAVARM